MSSSRGKIPAWAWPFAIACFAIPVVAIGGAIPGALGAGAGAYCLFSARETNRSRRFHLIRCSVVVLASWGLFLGLLGGVRSLDRSGKVTVTTRTVDAQGNETVTVSRVKKTDLDQITSTAVQKTGPDLTDETLRREIYAGATRMLDSLDDAKARREEDRRRGRDTGVTSRQVEHIQGMHEFDLEFQMKRYKITREQLDEILAEGDRYGWERR